MLDALIAGAGPVGLTMAAELARYGVRVRLIDRAAQPTQTSKALVVWSRTLELLDRAGCASAFLAAGLRGTGATIRHGTVVLGHTRLDAIESPYSYALMLPQSDTERLLAEHLRGLGVTVEREVELLDFTEQDGHVTARLRHADRSEEACDAAWLIGCDGAHSTVRHALGFQFLGATEPDDWMLADIRPEGEGAPPADEITVYLHGDGPLVFFPMPAGRARVVACLGRSAAGHPRPDPTLAEVQALVDARGSGGIAITDPVWLSNFRINERKVAEYRRGRAFLAGDAAHVHSPAGGQGMNTGMQDAFNLAWKLALVVRGEAASGLLDSYTPERSAVGAMVVRNTTRMTDMGTLANPAAQLARNFALRVMLGFGAIRSRMANAMSEIEIAYADSPLSVGRHAGDRLPPEQHDGAPPGSGEAPRFLLYDADEGAAAFAARCPALLAPVPRRPVEPGRMLIVRPDGYIGLSAAAGDWDVAARYLAAIATR